ncbi:MAG: mechanosensitive ion channel family protein, partial [Promethearchaeota archaeon]
VDRPFRVGDRIKTTSGVLGEVFEIGLRSMKLLDFEKNLHVIPNAEIVKAEVINYSYPDTKVRVKIEVGVAYGSDLEKVKKIILDIFSKHQKVLKSPKPSVFFINFGESSLDLLGVAYVNHYKDSWETGEELRMQVYNSFNKNNIEIPFPQNVVYLHKDVE